MKAKQLLILLLTGTLSLTLVGCNEPLEDNTTENPVEPGNGDDGGGDDGNGGDDGSGDGGDSGEPIENVGTWENKDEDGDGVLDEQDDYPFDNTRSRFTEVQDSEPNDNPSVATPISAGIPFRVKGAISNEGDNGDLYSFQGKEGDFVSALVSYESESFAPKAYFSDQSGLAINSSLIHYSKENKTLFVTVIIPKDGLFHLGMIDDNSGGDPSFRYQVDVFYDSDIDGILDNKERALGILPESQDTDKDGIPDFYEYYVDASIGLDFDGDGISNMLDDDSDGDSIPDKLEGFTDPDKDGFYNFIDFDSDGDSTPDSQEKVNDKGLPLDSDYDDMADFLDLDNDGDHILDIHDSAPYEKVDSISMDYSPFIQINSLSSLINGVTTKEVFRGDDTVIVNGMNMESVNDPLLIVYSQGNTYNFTPIYSEGKYRFNLNIPEGKYKAFLYVDDLKTNEIYISSYSNDVPLILGPSVVMLKRAANFTLDVAGATQDTKVILDENTIVPSSISPTSITFYAPENATKGTIYISNDSGTSNSISYDSQFESSVNIGNSYSNQKMLVSLSPVGIDAKRYFPGINIKFGSSHEPKLFFFDNINQINKVEKYKLSASINSINGNVKELHHADDEIISETKPVYIKQLHIPQEGIKHYQNNASSAESGNFHLNPQVVDYMDDFYDFSMEATTKFENGPEMNNCRQSSSWRDILGYDGCVELQNRTQLYLSTRVYKLDDEGNIVTDNNGKPIRDHIVNPWDTNIAAPQDQLFLGIEYWSKDKTYDDAECLYKPCLYQIVTPGVNSGYGPSPFTLNGSQPYDVNATKAKKALVIRTVIDNIFLRFFSFLFDYMGASVTDSKIVAMAQVIYQYGPKVSEQVDILLAKDTLTPGDFELMMDEIVKELYNTELVPLFSTNPRFGPLTSKLMEAAEIDAIGITQTLVNKAIAKLTPIYGQLKTAVEVSIVADLAIDIGKTIADLGFVAQKTDFSVTWGLNIADVQPRALVKGEQTYEVTVYGVGFNVSEGWIWDDYPVFTFVDSENSSHTFVSNEDDITVSDKGNKVVIILPGDFIDNTVGPLKLSVEHDDLNADSPYDIVVGEGIIISELTPDTGKPTDTITIVGSGFSSIPSENNVEFQGASGKIRANVVSVSSNQLTVKVPSGARTGAVTVSIDNIVSNELIFTIPYILEITYGDNGNFNDDIYKLKVNGDVVYDNNSPQRQIGPIEVPLSEGIHLVELEGIKADDGIATYYISFSGDVIDVTGDEMQGRDLCPQTTKSFNVNVGNAEENSNTKESLLLADQYVMIIQTEQSETQTECEVIE